MPLAFPKPGTAIRPASSLLEQIGKLKEGKVTISDAGVSLSGMARDLGGLGRVPTIAQVRTAADWLLALRVTTD